MGQSNVQNWFQSQTEDRPHGAADPSYFSAGCVITKGSWGGRVEAPWSPLISNTLMSEHVMQQELITLVPHWM